MILRSSPPSPFGRMVKIAAHVLDRFEDLTIENTDTMDAGDSIRNQNPLGKIPALILDDGRVVYDSRVILDYLDGQAGGGKIIPSSGNDRFEVMVRCAMFSGLLDAAILIVYESRFRPEDKRVPEFVEYQRDKIIRVLKAVADVNPSYTNGAMPDIGEIALACSIDYLDYRKPVNWRDYCTQIEQWMMDFSVTVPGYKSTLPEDIDPAPWR
jgi:glutathione S-transferase